MKLFKFKSEYKHGGHRVTIKRGLIFLPKIDAFQFLSLEKNLKELDHINKSGSVVCIVIDGWMVAKVNDKKYRLKKNQGILFEPGEKHKISRGKGIMLSISSKDYDKKLDTIYF